MSRNNLYNIQVCVNEKNCTYAEFHFRSCEKTIAELKEEEIKNFSFCRTMLTEIFRIIEIIGNSKVSEINKLVRPTVKYGETFDKESRFFEVSFSLGKISINAEEFKKFCFALVFREYDSVHTIDKGRFDFEFQALKDNKTYIDVVQSFNSPKVIARINDKLKDLALPIKTLIENTLSSKIPAIHLADVELEEFGIMEGKSTLVSSGIIIGSI